MNKYSSEDIKILKGLEAVRKRPGMYIGNVEDVSGLNHMLYELLDNSIDEAIIGCCNEIVIKFYQDGQASVMDNGRGIPITIHQEAKIPTPELILTTLHSGGKFDSNSYKVSGGLHGVGLSVVNALSSELFIQIHRDGYRYTQTFFDGKPQNHVIDKLPESEDHITGTFIKFKPSEDIFTVKDFGIETIADRLKELSYLNSGLKIVMEDQQGNIKNYQNDSGINSYIDVLTTNYNQIFKPIFLTYQDDDSGTYLETAFTWSQNFHGEVIKCYTNNIEQIDGGTHLTGFKMGLSKTISKIIAEHKVAAFQNLNFIPEDTRQGIHAIVSIKMPDPSFSSQTKDKLVSSRIRSLIDREFSNIFYDFLVENPPITSLLLKKIEINCRSREAGRIAREHERTLSDKNQIISALIGKLATCRSLDPTNSELFLVEGESAGSTAKGARNRLNQAILPLKGKILNVYKSNLKSALQSQEIANLIQAVKCGINENCNAEKSRFHKIIIMTDADKDGQHIATLIMTLFYKYMRPVIEAGYLYIAQSPLYSVKVNNKEIYLKDDDAKNDLFKKIIVETSEINVDNVALTNDEKLTLLEAYLKIKSIQALFKSQYGVEVIDTLGFMTPYVNSLDWWRKFMDKLQLKGNYSYGEFGCIVSEEDGIIKTFNILDIINSTHYQDITTNYSHINQYHHKRIGCTSHHHNQIGKDLMMILDNLFNYVHTKYHFKRYKGLGEMNIDQLRVSTMDVAYRTLVRVLIKDAEKAALIFETLMGTDVEARRQFIIDNIDYVRFNI